MAKPSDNGHYVYYSNGDSNKTCILVKLTDSALNAIENHLSSNSLALPSITFKSDTNNGVLSFPVPKSNHSHPDVNNENSGGGPSERRFSFNLSNAEAGGPQGSFECLRQTDSRVLKGLGSIQYKMQIHASEDSYERTKERMAESQNESKKYCTKVIKGIGSTVGRRSKVKKITGFSQSIVNGSRDNGTRDSGGGGGTISNNSSHLHHSSALSSHNHHKSSSPTVIKSNSSGVNKYNLYHGSSNSTTISSSSSLSSSSGTGLTSTTTSTSSSSSLSTNSSSISSSNSLANNISSSSSSNTSSSLTNSQPSSINGSNLSMNRDAIKGNNSNSSTPNCNINASNSRNANSGSKVTLACNPELMKKSLRERVIHLLALRPYKKPELLARLNKEGIKEKDKKNLSQVFNTISKLKENAYNLAAHAWHEVQVDDWPFYTPEQREIVRKRKTLEIQQRSSTGKYGLSPLTCLQDSSPSASSVATSSSSTNNTNTNNSNSINNNNNNNSSLSSSTSKRSAETGSSNKRQRLNANNQSSSKRGLSPNVALNHNTNSMMNNSTNNSNNFNNSGKNDLPDIMSEWSMKPRSPEPNYYTNSASNHNVDNSVNNGENNSGSMSKSWINENGSDENRSSHNASDYYSGRSTVNNLSDFDQYDNSHGNGHSSHDAHRTTNGYSNSSEGGNQTVNGHHYNNNNNRYSSNNNNNNNNNNSNNNYHHHGNSMSTSKSDYNGDLHNSSGSGNSNSGNGLNSRKRLKNGYNNNNNNNNSVNNNNSHSNHNSNMNNNNNNHSHHSSGMVNLLNSGSMVNGSNCSTPNSSPDSGTGSNDGNLSTISSKSLSSINCELPDYAIKFVEITSDDQSRKYKEEFNSEYKEYRRLHRNIDQVARKFSAFEAKLKSLPEGSDEWNKTLEEVFKEYDTIKKDYKFMESKRRVAYLHEKLSHIKKLIQEYKSSQGHRSTHYNTTTMSHHHTNYNNHHNNHNYHHHHKQQSNHHS